MNRLDSGGRIDPSDGKLEISDALAAQGITGLPRLQSGEDITPGRNICRSCKKALAVRDGVQCVNCFLAGAYIPKLPK